MSRRQQRLELCRSQTAAQQRLHSCEQTLDQQKDLLWQTTCKLEGADRLIMTGIKAAEGTLRELTVGDIAEPAIQYHFVPEAVHVSVQVLSLAAGLRVEESYWQPGNQASRCKRRARQCAYDAAKESLCILSARLDETVQEFEEQRAKLEQQMKAETTRAQSTLYRIANASGKEQQTILGVYKKLDGDQVLQSYASAAQSLNKLCAADMAKMLEMKQPSAAALVVMQAVGVCLGWGKIPTAAFGSPRHLGSGESAAGRNSKEHDLRAELTAEMGPWETSDVVSWRNSLRSEMGAARTPSGRRSSSHGSASGSQSTGAKLDFFDDGGGASGATSSRASDDDAIPAEPPACIPTWGEIQAALRNASSAEGWQALRSQMHEQAVMTDDARASRRGGQACCGGQRASCIAIGERIEEAKRIMEANGHSDESECLEDELSQYESQSVRRPTDIRTKLKVSRPQVQ
jgi:hypothetical protein